MARWLVGAVAAVVTLSSPAAAWSPALDRLIEQARLDTAVSPPDPSLPDDVKAWLGRWEGRWLAQHGQQEIALIVRSIRPDRAGSGYAVTAVVVWGPAHSSSGEGYRGVAYQTEMQLQGKTLTDVGRSTGRTTVWTMREDSRTLDGRQVGRAGFFSTGTLQKALDQAEAKRAEQLRALESLRQSGAITDEQYRRAVERLGGQSN